MSCTPGAGAEELVVERDAPSEDDGVTGFFVYVSPDGNQLARLAHVGVGDAALAADGPRWSTTVGPVPAAGAIDVAVTAVDEAGNESGWYPIDAYYVSAGTSCHSGAPPAPEIVIIWRGGGSGEIEITVTPLAPDVVDYTVSADIDGAGFTSLPISSISDSTITPGEVIISASFVIWTLPTIYRVVAIDADGNASPPTER